ncbi:hypothetical protein BaRGS_00000161 [Batillaria attramentaria]|uniref:Elongator complex protein 2 n=1 Tax=Batillaria attramentaria TaxID=370345 RepID=A0ABD0M9J2_9CAEN
MADAVHTCYVSSGCNRVPHCADWGRNGLICYGSCNSVIIYRPDYKVAAALKGHTGSVTVAAALYVTGDCDSPPDRSETLIATASVDSTVRVWQRKSRSQDIEECQTLTFGTGFAVDLSLLLVPDTQVPLLACGVDDHKVHLFVRHGDQFTGVMKLSGHEDWVQGVHLTVDDTGDILLASCAQDQLIRIWRLAPRSCDTGHQKYYAVSLESVLSGHEGWIYSVQWQPHKMTEEGKWSQPMCLLSASMDKTMIVWSPDIDSGVWVEQVRVGEVGGNTLGFYGGLFSPHGNSILAHGYQGALHQWTRSKELNAWEPAVTGGGHFAGIQDMDWDRGGGNFVLTTSLDQTTRLHAPWVLDGKYMGWFEIARPQIHGYDMQCLTMINRYMFASAGDEKVARVFQAPRNFIENLCHISGLNLANELAREEVSKLPEGASVPALGLSNKAVFDITQPTADAERLIPAQPNDQYTDMYFHPISLTAPPSEEHLLQNTLWPEVHKLYGHSYEVFALAADPAGKLLASSCKASKAEHANILLWDTATWQKVASLDGSSLTVVQMAFSPSGQFLLAVSRDRTWSLYRCADGSFSRVSFVDKKTSPHSRIIWACAWSQDERYFFTSSRDKKVVVWSLTDVCKTHPPQPVATLETKDSVTAVDVAPVTLPDSRYLLAVGHDGGEVVLYTFSPHPTAGDIGSFSCLTLDKCHHHQLTVKRVKFRPVTGLAGHHQRESEAGVWLQLATCGADHSLKVHNINLVRLAQDTVASATPT